MDEFTGLVDDYDPETDVDEWIVCSAADPGHPQVGHSCHTDFRMAKLAQIALFLKGTDTWIEHIKPFGPPTIEEQLDVEIALRRAS